jgi:alkanesulfonate monooxygenase SsuD/methylene tetrahydromethanopterin reductase-like flavin-dependent oxidoreductase (luciferase family)
VRHAVFLPPFDDLAEPPVLVDVARLAEDRGWDGVFLWDHVQRAEVRPVADPWICLAAVAATTSRILLGPMVTPLVRRRPQKLAREVVTLDRLSGGRLVLGIGLGVDSGRELSAFGEVVDAAERGRMLDEGLEVLCGLLSGEAVHHAGPHYTADGVRFLPTPVGPGGVPMWLAARTTARAPLRRAARHDGVFFIENGPEAIAEMLGWVGEQRRALGRGGDSGLEGFDVAAAGPGIGGGDARDDHDPDRFAAAGVTWWMTSFRPGDALGAVLDRIAEGPPV